MNRLFTVSLIVLATFFGSLNPLRAGEAGKVRVYFGTNTNEKIKGIYFSVFDLATGILTPADLAVDARNPSFVAIHPTRKFLCAVSEISDFQGKSVGGVAAFFIDSASRKNSIDVGSPVCVRFMSLD